MPELPDVTVYLEALQSRLLGKTLRKVRLASPFVLRTYEPTPRDVEGKQILALRRLGKRIVFGLEDDLFIVIHLMIAGRFKWLATGAKLPGRLGLAAFDFDDGTLVLTEAGSKSSSTRESRPRLHPAERSREARPPLRRGSTPRAALRKFA